MSGRQSSAVASAVRMVQRGSTVTAAAAKHGVALSSIQRAMRAAGLPPLAPGRPSK